MLQFFITTNEEYRYGADYDNPTADGYKRVVYYDTVIYDEAKLKEPPKVTSENTPLERAELAIDFDDFLYSVLLNSDSGDDLLAKACAELGVTLSSEQLSEILNLNIAYGTKRVGGELEFSHEYGGICGFTDNLSFAQGDVNPDGYVNLVQFVSVGLPTLGDYLILWGDAGTAHFYIKPEKLAVRDFSETYYYWDCG
jgi:uncharacterized protein YwqG